MASRALLGLALGALGAGCIVDGASAGRGTLLGQKALPSAPAVLEVPAVEQPWAPSRRVAGRSGALTADLAATLDMLRADELEVAVSPALAARLDTEALARGLVELTAPGSPRARTVAVDVDPFVRPLPVEKGAQPQVHDGADLPARTRAWIVEARPDLGAWRARPAVVEGSCAPAQVALGRGQAGALARLEPFFAVADERLARRFRARLAQAWPSLSSDAARLRAGAERGDARSCVAALDDLVARLEGCVEGATCGVAPRVFVDDRVFIASEGLTDEVLAACEGTDADTFLQATRAPARAATQAVAGRFEAGWVAYADRLAGLVAVHQALERACAPRRRRISRAGESQLREIFEVAVDALGSPAADGARWSKTDGAVHVAGIGKVERYMAAESGPGANARAAAARMVDLAGRVSRCGEGDGAAPPLAVVLTSEGAVRWMHLVYPEQLACP